MGFIVKNSDGETVNIGDTVWTDGSKPLVLAGALTADTSGSRGKVRVRKAGTDAVSVFTAGFFGLTVSTN